MALRKDLHWSSLAILAARLLSVGPVGIIAQSSTAVCLSSFSWMVNSKNQNPCVVSAYLLGACNGGQFTVDPLQTDHYYAGPSLDEQNACQCSSVTYNTISACGLCQNCTIISWSAWDFNCSTIYPGIFPPGIPAGTAVPQWAFQDVTTSDMFNVTLAQSVGDNPESTASSAQSTGSLNPTLALASASSTSETSSQGSSSNAGAIAGAVVGGVVGLALIAGVVIFLFVHRKKRFQIPPSEQFKMSPDLHSVGHTDSSVFPLRMAQPKFYDPSDPSTFPPSPFPITTGTASSRDNQNAASYSTSSVRPGGYSGVPEI